MSSARHLLSYTVGNILWEKRIQFSILYTRPNEGTEARERSKARYIEPGGDLCLRLSRQLNPYHGEPRYWTRDLQGTSRCKSVYVSTDATDIRRQRGREKEIDTERQRHRDRERQTLDEYTQVLNDLG